MKRLVIACILILAAFCPVATGAVDTADEYEIKAAMYINLLRLVDWPPGTLSDSSLPLIVGISGSDDMLHAMDVLLRSRGASASRQISVRKLSGISGFAECHSVFVGGGDKKRAQAILQAISTAPVLTVGESSRFLDLGGMIDLSIRDEKVQIEINIPPVRQTGLSISSRLLKIAVLRNGGGS